MQANSFPFLQVEDFRQNFNKINESLISEISELEHQLEREKAPEENSEDGEIIQKKIDDLKQKLQENLKQQVRKNT